MKDDVKRDADFSKVNFERVVWPAIASAIGGGTYESAEGAAKGSLGALLDCFGNCDGFQRVGLRVLPISQRTRRYTGGPDSRIRHDFTIRWTRKSGVPTEIHKLLEGALDDATHPLSGWVVTSWVSDSAAGLQPDCLWAAAVPLRHYARWIQEHREMLEQRVKENRDGGSSFSYINVDEDFADCAWVRVVSPAMHPVLADQLAARVWKWDPDSSPAVSDDKMLAWVMKVDAQLMPSGAVITKHNLNTAAFRRAFYYWIRISDAGKAWARGQEERRAMQVRLADPDRLVELQQRLPTRATLDADTQEPLPFERQDAAD